MAQGIGIMLRNVNSERKLTPPIGFLALVKIVFKVCALVLFVFFLANI